MKDISSLHQTEYDAPPDCVGSAPAVVKFLGEHSDFNDGLVLTAALSFEMKVAISLRKDTSMRFFAADFNERKRASTGTLKYKREDRWANNIKSIYDYFSKNYHFEGKGINVTIQGNIPQGLGLGTTAAINMASALALKMIFSLPLRNDELADIVCKAQSIFFEKQFALTDYLSQTAPGSRTLSIVDLRTSRRRSIHFLDEPWTMVLVDSKVPRFLIESELKQRSNDCKRCLSVLSPKGTKTLRDIRENELEELMGVVPESARRRCLHIVEETSRVGEAEEALLKQDAISFGKILNKSHNSLRTLYEVSCPEIDWLVKRAQEIDGVLCSRLTGPGFGGCTFSIMKPESLPEFRKRLEEYERIFGFKAQIHETGINGALKTST
jgi:galactokinase